MNEEKDRETNRQTDRQTDRKREGERDRERRRHLAKLNVHIEVKEELNYMYMIYFSFLSS